MLRRTWLTLLCLPLLAHAQPDTLWTRTYTYDFFGGAGSAVATPDGGYLFAGAVRLEGHPGDQDGYALKVDQQGDIQWSQTYGPNGGQGFSDVIALPDGRLVMGGAEGTAPFLICLDATGVEHWRTIVYDQPFAWGIIALAPAPAGGLVCASDYRDFPQPIHPYLMLVDSTGHPVWTRHYPISPREAGFVSALAACPAGGWVLAGGRIHVDDTTGERSGGWVIRVDGAGDTLWTHFVPRACWTFAHVMPSGDIVLGGYEDVNDSTRLALYLRLDVGGHERWRRYPIQNAHLAVQGGSAFDDGRVAFRFENSNVFEWHTAALVLTTSDGDSAWQYNLGRWPLNIATLTDVAGTPQTGLLCLNGSTSMFEDVNRQYLVRLVGDSAPVPGEPPVPLSFGMVTGYPNPFNAQVTLAFECYQESAFVLELFDALGRQVLYQDLGQLQPGPQQLRLTLPDLPTGRYFSRVTANRTARAIPLVLVR